MTRAVRSTPWSMTVVVALLASVDLSMDATPCRADADLDKGINKLAANISQFLKRERQTAVIVGDFIAPPKLKASGGPGISQLLAEQFKKLGIQVNDQAAFQVMGKFELKAEKDDLGSDVTALKIKADVLGRDDEVVQSFAISVFGTSGLQLAGNSVDLTGAAFGETRNQKIKDSINKPQSAIIGNETRVSEASLFGVEVHVRDGDKAAPRTPTLDGGRSFVELKKGEEYVVRLVNHATFEAAVTLTIDGLSMFAFSKEGNTQAQVLIAANSAVEIPGWYSTVDKTEAFIITGYPESAAGQRGITTGVGTISASFSAAWPKGAEQPEDEPYLTTADDIATGRGRIIDKKYKKVEREIGQVRAIVSVRYTRGE